MLIHGCGVISMAETIGGCRRAVGNQEMIRGDLENQVELESIAGRMTTGFWTISDLKEGFPSSMLILDDCLTWKVCVF